MSANCSLDTELTSIMTTQLETAFYEDMKKFEAFHPEITLDDLIDHSKRMPEDTFVGKASNQVILNSNLLPLHKHRHNHVDIVIHPHRAYNTGA